MPWKVYMALFESIKTYCTNISKGPTITDLTKTINEIREQTAAITTDVKAIKYNTQHATTTKVHTPTVNSWAAIASRAPPPPSIASKLTSSPPSDTSSEFHRITLRVNDKIKVNALQALPNPYTTITEKINCKLKDSSNTVLQQVTVKGVRILRSHDLQISTESPAQAEILRIHRKEWQQCLGEQAQVLLPTYGVIVHGIPIKSVENLTKEEMLRKFEFENQRTLEENQLADYHWLKKARDGQRDASIILNFHSPKAANALIHAEVAYWENAEKKTTRYDRASQIKRCFRCHHYGHIGTQCPRDEICGHCAGKAHTTKECSNKGESKCALCNGPHKAWSTACPHYKKAQARADAARLQAKQIKYWAEPAVDISPGPSELLSKNGSAENPVELDKRPASPMNKPTKRPAAVSPRYDASQSSPKKAITIPKSKLKSNGITTNAKASTSKKAARPTPFTQDAPAQDDPDAMDTRLTEEEAEEEEENTSSLSKNSDSSKSSTTTSSTTEQRSVRSTRSSGIPLPQSQTKISGRS
jgi:hypothetical protein